MRDNVASLLRHLIAICAGSDSDHDGVVVRITPVRKTPSGRVGEIIAILRESEPLSTKEILGALARRGLAYGDTGVKLTLAVLVDLGIAEVVHGKGYRLSR